ncbi:MAG TPA: hypothetical protein ENI87_04600 [bacterium]|nr:hypothetical protein [bacterium]
MHKNTNLARVISVPLLLASAAFAQSQGSVTITFQPNGAAEPTGCHATPPSTAAPGTTVEITKIEEQTSDGQWHDVTNAWTRSNNPSKKVTCTKPSEASINKKTFRFTYKTSSTIQGDIVLTTTY